MLLLLISAGLLVLNQINAMVCTIGLEPDPSAGNIFRRVIPVEDPCRCTEIQMGGMNIRTPGRNFKVIYFDVLMSSADELSNWFNCSGGRTGSKVESDAVVDEGASSDNDPQFMLTTGAVLQLEGTACGADNMFKVDPYDCALFYACSYGFWIKKSCGEQYFNTDFNGCDFTQNVPCPRGL
ncbi:uncharacterized protein [Asterias amurensis]|uniref:uncharacterized protein n=1 Tax=Asterias amurensis TaxID=7602 RepID=UPI003AB64A69